jgi:hypothetical protein
LLGSGFILRSKLPIAWVASFNECSTTTVPMTSMLGFRLASP